jgi:malonyl-CoA decarboxylase
MFSLSKLSKTLTSDALRAAPAALSARAQARQLQRAVEDCRRLLSERGEANSVAIATEVLRSLSALSAEAWVEFFAILDADFGPDPARVLGAAEQYAQAPSAKHLIELTAAAEPPRQELLRRLSRAPGGTALIVAMRRVLLEALRTRPTLAAVEADFLHLLGSWFNAGFLQMEQVDWRSSAALLEKIIHHEAVHEIDGWADLRRRLQPDRRCFAFFHPQLPNEPLIFVEVALVATMPDAIGPLIDKSSAPLDERDFKVAAFYSISNCQPGLRGVSLGNFLIKRVAEHLQREIPRLRTFCTLSPIPGFTDWLLKFHAREPDGALNRRAAQRVQQARDVLQEQYGSDLTKLVNGFAPERASTDVREALVTLASFYLQHESVLPGGNPVAKFHLGNGARLERLNWAGDLSRKGLKQSLGIMVNYLYDLNEVEDNHERFVHGEVVSARRIAQRL